MENLNRSPYFDDYDESKKFHKVLYRPSYAVQARELTQQQTIFQKQIERFGNHIFKNGSMVIPGHVHFDVDVHYVKLSSTYDGFEVDEKTFVGYEIEGVTSGAKAEVILSSGLEGTDPKTLYVKYSNTGAEGYSFFIDGEILQRVDNALIQCTVAGIADPETFESTGKSSITSIAAGVYYINGNFVLVDAQSVIVEKYSPLATKRIGLQLYEYLVTPEDDSSLVDNAQGSYNYAAPGAHRYKLELILTVFAVDAILPDDFIELQRVNNGNIINEIRTTDYNELEKTLARRTFDESGNYTVKPYNVNIKEHLLDTTVPRLVDGKYLIDEGGDETKFAIGIEPGVSYVRGFERVNLSTVWLETLKPRTFAVSNNSVTNFNIGQYIYIDKVFRMPDFRVYPKINLWNTVSTDGNTTGTNIGSAKVRAIQLVDKDSTASISVYKLFLFDISLKSGYAWSDVKWLAGTTASTFTARTTVANTDFSALDNIIHDPTQKSAIFNLPHEYVKTLKIDGISDTTYTVLRTYSNEAVTAGTVTLTAGTNAVFDTFNGTNYIVVNLAGTTADNSFIAITTGSVTGGGTGTITIAVGAISNVMVIVPVIKLVANEKAKSLQLNRVFNIASPNKIPNGVDVLDRADGVELVSVIEDPAGAATDITNRYTFDSGQRNSHYDLARIKLNSSATAPASDIRVTFNYFSHGAGDYCSIDSYSALDYTEVPTFNSEDATYNLSDCVDFRPVIDSTGLAFTGAGGQFGEIPQPLSNLRADYQHYLGRIDKLSIDYLGVFSIIEGNPSVTPAPPKSPDDGMILYEIYMNPYGFSVDDAKIKFIDNKRYTMRDIGRLEKRITNLEYYTALSLLEKDTAQMQIKDDEGFDRFKNGFIVEPFKSHLIGDSTNLDYKCSIDPNEEKMRPTFKSDSISLLFDSVKSTNVQMTGPLITLPYTSVPFITQPLNSTSSNINPFAVRAFKGKITFVPDSDVWYDTVKNGTVIVNDDENYNSMLSIAKANGTLNGVVWNDWQTAWSSSASRVVSTTERVLGSSSVTSRAGSTTTTTTSTQVATDSIIATTNTTGQVRTGTTTTVSSGTVYKDLGDRVVGINYIPFMRAKDIIIKVDGLKPNTRVFPFFDSIAVHAYCRQAHIANIGAVTGKFKVIEGQEERVTCGGGTATAIFYTAGQLSLVSWNGVGFRSGQTIIGASSGATAVLTSNVVLKPAGGPFVSDDFGRLNMLFSIPSNNTLKFRTGERQFILNDQSNNSLPFQTSATGVFKSEGQLTQTEGSILATKTITFTSVPVSQSRALTDTSTSTTSSTSTRVNTSSQTTTTVRVPTPVVPSTPIDRLMDLFPSEGGGGGSDPLAQTFEVTEEGGCFVTKVDVYFRSKDTKGLPVWCQIREVVNGYPGKAVAPYSEVYMYPNDIAISTNGSVATTFNMIAPVYLQQGAEYCFVLLTESFDYNVWIGEVGGTDIISNIIIAKQPHSGVLFKSQNASTWSADQNQDLKFILYKAKYEVETIEGSGVYQYGSIIFNNNDINDTLTELELNPIETKIGSDEVRVYQYGHGFTPNSYVTLSGFSGTYNGIPASELNDTHTISNVEMDSYVITVTTSANASGRIGNYDIFASKNIQMDIIRPSIAQLVLPETSSSWGIKATTSKSINGDQVPYVKDAVFSGISITENNYFLTPKMIASVENEAAFLAGAKSLEFENVIWSNNRNLSPVIDTHRISAITVANRIDSPEVITENKTLTVSAGSKTVSVAHTEHGMTTGAVVGVTSAVIIGTIPIADLTGYFSIVRVNDNSYTFTVETSATPANDSDTVAIEYSNTNHKYVPENMPSGGSVIAKYLTRKISVVDAAVGVKIYLTAVLQDKADFEIWYRKQSPADTSLFTDLPWEKFDVPDLFVPLSTSIGDFKDYEFSKDFFLEDGITPDEFTSIAVKIVMKSTDSTRVPIFDNIRIICLGV